MAASDIGTFADDDTGEVEMLDGGRVNVALL